MELKNALSDYTEYQFKELITAIQDAETESQRDNFLLHFKKIVSHPAGTDLIYYPEPGAVSSAEGITETVKKWREANGLPGFKSVF
jgi:type I site-specific restriction-modification system R (restriction) subunit